MRVTWRFICICVLLLIGQASVACAGPSKADANVSTAQQDPSVTVVNSVEFSPGQVHQLSGITYLGHNDYFVVSDKGGLIVSSTIEIDRETGEITKAQLADRIDTKVGKDLEDIAFDHANARILISDESGSWIRSHDVGDGRVLERIQLTHWADKIRGNRGLESLAIAPDSRQVWTAVEEALASDGARSTAEDGTTVRLQRLTKWLKPQRQYFYKTDPHMGDANLIKRAQSGVVGLVALDNGWLIVMERALGGSAIPTFRIRLYLVETNITATGDGSPTRLDKKLLAQVNAGFANYEGITLGPKLNNGDYALLLVSDDGGGDGYNPQRLMSLRVSGKLIESMQTPDKAGD